MKINELHQYLAQLLQVDNFKDYCPNGLQVEGKQDIQKIVTGVTASYDLLLAAQRENADAILVHHGYFWRGESLPIVGIKKQRLSFLLRHDINLLAYHLPLDAHAKLGNNAMLAQHLGLNNGHFSDEKIIFFAELSQPQPLKAFVSDIEAKLNRAPLVIGDLAKSVQRIAICTGAAQGYIEQAVAANVDVYISGEISEQTVHIARESGVAYVAAGHHATERYGIKALGEHLSQQFGLAHVFVDCDNPV